MKLVDANVLVYAGDTRSEHHDASRRWLDRALAGQDRVGFPWLVLVAFLRLTTNRSLFARPLEITDATDQLDLWLGFPTSVVVQPGPRHLDILRDLLVAAGTAGNAVNDAHIAALAVEHRADVVSYDADFGRFPRVRWMRPDDVAAPDLT